VPGYAEFHARSAFSFLEGASLPEDLIERAAELEIPAIALLDRDGVYGAPRFHTAATRAGLRAFIGAEVTSAEGCRYPLLVANRTGYQNLCRLITRMKLRAPKGEAAATPEDLAQHAAGLICLTGGEEGPLAQALRKGLREARACLEQLISIFGKHNIYVELQRHYERGEEARNQALMELAASLRLPLLATNGVRYARPERRQLLDALTAVRHKVTIFEAGRLLERNSERYLKPAGEMDRLFADVPEAVRNTEELAARIAFTLADLGYRFPRYPVPPGETMNSFLRRLVEAGARERYRPSDERARRQMERELALIEKLDLAGYFLIVWDIVRFCREQGILVQGRGSAANSAVCYVLGITAVDPVGMDLLFERFLSEERGEWPDIDLDLPSGEQRERVIQYVYQRYGPRGAAMTANVITYRDRSAVRDLGKALGFPEEALARLGALAAGFEWDDPENTPERCFREAGLDLRDPLARKFLELYQAAQDLPRHLGQHSGGMVICEDALDAVVPLEPATMPGRVVIQWDKEDCADMGIIKVDLLGLGMMAALEESIRLIRAAWGEPVDLARLPKDDPAVYEALQKADTIGMFQVESRAQMSCLPRLKPEKFYDLVVEVAIIRPGPIVGKMVHPYLRRRQGLEPVSYPHPSLEPVLRRTLGVPLFQEQLLRMAMTVAGFTGGEAEELRRAMGFKRSEKRMKEIEVKLRQGMERNGIDPEAQEKIVQSITSFALYGFPESHAASFALLAYASAWIKVHYPAAFVAALLNCQPMGFYHPATLIKDAQRHGVHFRPVDVTRSEAACTIEEDEHGQKYVRLGLNYVKGLRAEAAAAIVAERARAPFRNIEDLIRRARLRKDEVAVLAEAGALNSLLPAEEAHRRAALWEAARAVRPAGELYAGASPAGGPSPLARMTLPERLRADFRTTDVTIGPHPMRLHRERLRRAGVRAAAELKLLPQGARVRTAGCVICRQRPGTAKGFVFLSLEDETGVANVILTPDFFDRHRVTIVSEPYLLVEGPLQNQDGVIHVRAERVEPMPLVEIRVESRDFR
jgi:error-prone DNA polymerase